MQPANQTPNPPLPEARLARQNILLTGSKHKDQLDYAKRKLSSDHLLILITLYLSYPLNTTTKTTYISYRKTDWVAFILYIETKVQNLCIDDSSTIDHAKNIYHMGTERNNFDIALQVNTSH